VTIFHGSDISSYVRARGPEVYQDLFARGDRFLGVSEYFVERLLSLGAAPDRTLFFPMGVDLDRFVFQPRPKLANPVSVVTVGRLTEKKGVEYALRAIHLLKDKFQIRYTVAGDGELRRDLESSAFRLGLGGQVCFIGSVSQARVAELLTQADLFVQPFVTAQNGDQEGLPLTIKEAMARGVPVITTAHAGMGEMITDGVNGILVGERDAISLAKALEQAIMCEQLRSRLQVEARKTVEARYDIRVLNRELLDILRGLEKRREA
jgi:colanic acid/amylovoran biosynthesis glycosyltransferase